MTGLSLFKFMPGKYVDTFVNEGCLLFRNLTSFKQMEDLSRGDVREGCHVDSPNNDVVIENLSNGTKISGRFSMRTSIIDEKVFVFCMARSFKHALYDAFGSGACVVIRDPNELIRRCRLAIKRLMFIDGAGCIHGEVEYYRFDQPIKRSIKDPLSIPFLKSAHYQDQNEYRIVFGRKGAFKLTKRIIVDQNWNIELDHLKGKPKEKFLKIGSIADISETRYK